MIHFQKNVFLYDEANLGLFAEAQNMIYIFGYICQSYN